MTWRNESLFKLKSLDYLSWKQNRLRKRVYIIFISFILFNYIRRVISFDEGAEFAKNNELIFFECSARNGYNIDLVINI